MQKMPDSDPLFALSCLIGVSSFQWWWGKVGSLFEEEDSGGGYAWECKLLLLARMCMGDDLCRMSTALNSGKYLLILLANPPHFHGKYFPIWQVRINWKTPLFWYFNCPTVGMTILWIMDYAIAFWMMQTYALSEKQELSHNMSGHAEMAVLLVLLLTFTALSQLSTVYTFLSHDHWTGFLLWVLESLF